jgi:hypothetical protein
LLHKNKVKYIFYVPNDPKSTPEWIPSNTGESILDIYTKYGYKVTQFRNMFQELTIQYTFVVPFFLLENTTF